LKLEDGMFEWLLEPGGTMMAKPLITVFGISLLAVTSSFQARGQTNLLAPEAKPGTYYAAFPHQIQLDGKLEDWIGVPRVTVRDGPKPGLNLNDNDSITFAVTADDQNIYLLGITPDKNIIAGQKKNSSKKTRSSFT
jgi:hypothetical protein